MAAKTRNLAVVVATLAVFAAGALFFLTRGPDGAESAGPAARAERAAEPEASSPLAPPTDDPARGEVASGAASDPTLNPVQQPAPFAPREFGGSFVVERRDGSIDQTADGSFDLVVWNERNGFHQPVTVARGRWSARVEGARAREVRGVSVASPHAGQRAALLLEPKERFEPVDPLAIAVRVREARETLLRVVDAATRAELAPLELVSGGGLDSERHPGPAEGRSSLGSAFSSPVDIGEGLALPTGVTSLLVRSPGYAWGSVTLEIGSGTERTLELQPGGDLRLALRGAVPQSSLAVRLRPAAQPGDEPLVDAPVGQRDSLLIDGLAPGRYTAVAELGDWWRSPLRLGEVGFEIRAGALTDAQLDVAAPPAVELAELAGVLAIPAAWDVERPSATLQLEDAPSSGRRGHVPLRFERAADEGALRILRFRAADLQVGSYSFTMYEPPHSELIELPAGGRSDVRIEVPPPGELVVRLVNLDTGERARPELLMWHPEWRPGIDGGSLENASYDPALDGYLVRAPVGLVELMAMHGSGLDLVETKVRVALGRREVEVGVLAVTEVELVLLDGDVRQPFPDGWTATLLTADREPVPPHTTYSTTLRLIRLPGGGRYVIQCDPLPGYEPIPELEFEVRAHVRSKVEIALVRKP